MQEAFTENYFAGFIETVPAYSSLAVFYDVVTLKTYVPLKSTAFEFVKNYAEKLIAQLNPTVTSGNKNLVTIPVFYNGADLEYIAGLHNIPVEELIAIHSGPTYRVFMIGFQPGFPYMGKLDQRIVTARRPSPRTEVPAGAVAIAGAQTGIYPFASPGGWQLVGQTPLKIFDKTKTDPCMFKAGDEIKFTAITKKEFEKANEY